METELPAIHGAKNRGRPYGQEARTIKTAVKLGVQSSLRPSGRPKKEKPERPFDLFFSKIFLHFRKSAFNFIEVCSEGHSGVEAIQGSGVVL